MNGKRSSVKTNIKPFYVTGIFIAKKYKYIYIYIYIYIYMIRL
jgi:hypothetical protein